MGRTGSFGMSFKRDGETASPDDPDPVRKVADYAQALQRRCKRLSLSTSILKASVTTCLVPGSIGFSDAQDAFANVNSISAVGSRSICADQTAPYVEIGRASCRERV